ncbi:hypothetical protein TM902_180044 [Tenacibaculum maritimum]|uniref:hypothetical protein n=1 Tax=Tenacibaculum maritimum TaxID=107401 RepID=UPI0012E466FC|nr:hypothetical protein [Tenacibaculum maritimum]MCD9582286.1 hypothetical protein [Tenacibaculum maritimum]MCD9636668.1 hypothetical protein [Tenacibaculum maritimum]CAA0144743.1 hypothetical protein TM902_180044 [Tenacibaculum maritimum]CAA0193359.1 hypothetical protein USCSE301_250040 [Tenacibaculum maritimum]
MGKSNKQKALDILNDRPHLDVVYMNTKGEFFTEKYLADNSNQGKGKTQSYSRPKKKGSKADKPATGDKPQTVSNTDNPAIETDLGAKNGEALEGDKTQTTSDTDSNVVETGDTSEGDKTQTTEGKKEETTNQNKN